jgi:hypothetical protein
MTYAEQQLILFALNSIRSDLARARDPHYRSLLFWSKRLKAQQSIKIESALDTLDILEHAIKSKEEK